MDAFGDDAIADLLVDDDTDGSGVDIEDGSSAPMIVFVRHALVNGSINCNVNDISDLVGSERFGDVNGSVLLEPFSELVSGSTLVPV